MLGTIATILAALAPALGPPPEADWTTRYEVRFGRGGEGTPQAEIAVTLGWNGGRGSWPEHVEVAMEEGWGAFVRDAAARVPEGSKEPRDGYRLEVLSAADGRFRLPVLGDGRAGLRYTVVLEHAPEEMLGYDETPHAFAGGVFWTGRALFVTHPRSDAELVLAPPEGEHVSTSFEPAEGEHEYRAPGHTALLRSFLVVGPRAADPIELEGSTFLVVLDDPVAEEGDLVVAELRTFLTAANELFGGPPPPRCLVLVESHESEGGGAVVGHDAHVLVTTLPLFESDDQWLRSLCHELFHLWNPTTVGFDSREMWYSEGFTDYWTHRLLARGGQITGSRFLEVVRGWAADYLGEDDERGLRAAGELGSKNRTLVYQGGALAAFCLDVGIRDASGNKRALDGVMAALYELCAAAGGEIPVAELERLLAKHGGRGLGDFLERHVAGNEPLPLAACFADAGLVLESLTLSMPERDAAVRLIQVPGATAMEGGILIQRTSGGKLKPDDLLIEVDGVRIGGWDDLRRALGGRAPGDEVPARVRRKGKEKDLELQLGGHGEELSTSEEDVVLLRPAPKAKKKQRAIRAALFGELE